MKTVTDLNPEQHRAVTTTEGPVLVLAGAGTGKTRVITVRIAYLLKKRVAPESILAMTFTNKAAREMRERVAGLVGKKKAERIFIGTFHSFCIDLLRRYGEVVGLGRFTISDGGDQAAMIRSSMREVTVGEVSLQPGAVLSRISLAKNRLESSESLLDQAADDTEEYIGRVWRRYEEQLRRSRSLDFDDILLFALEILRKRGGPIRELRERYRYVMVDEYQDTNGPQYEIVQRIAAGHRNLCVVGDDDQSIYGWRGADPSKILGFEKDFPGAAVIKLETNYRSTEPILTAANRVIRNNQTRHDKTLQSAIGEGHPLQLAIAEDEAEEADYIAREIQSLVRRDQARLGDFAILFRTGPQARSLETALRARDIRYVLVGGLSFFDRKEVRDVVAYLKLVANPDDELALLRIVNRPPRGIGKVTIDRVFEHATKQGLSASAAFSKASSIPGVPTGAGKAAEELFHTIDSLRKLKGGLVQKVQRIVETVSYRAEVDKSYPDELTRNQRWGAVEEILSFAENHERKRRSSSLLTFLQELALEADDDASAEDESERRQVTLMTLHSAKGLEFPRVYLTGLEEGLLPHARSVAEDTVEEERRLCYVGITRAKRHLTLTLTKSRAVRGHRIETMPSRFLFELKDESPPKGWIPAGAERPKKKTASRKKARRRGARR